MRQIKKHISILLVALIVITAAGCGSQNDEGTQQAEQLDSARARTAAFLLEHVKEPGIGPIGGDWTVFGLSRAGADVPEQYYHDYIEAVCRAVKEKKGVLEQRRYTEYARVCIALTQLGADPRNVEGYDLLEPLEDVKKVTAQGLNGAIFALIASKCGGYRLKAEQQYLDYLLKQELPEGGFALDEWKPADPDLTAMTVQALAFYQSDESIKAVIDRTIEKLAAMQEADGSYACTETNVQVIIALTAARIDPRQDPRFSEKGKNPVEAMMEFQTGDGFSHEIGQDADLLATDQAMCAFAALKLFEEGKTLYGIAEEDQ